MGRPEYGLGICYASEEIIEILNKIKPPYNVNVLTQEKALERLQIREEVEQEVKMILQKRLFREGTVKNGFCKGNFSFRRQFYSGRVDDADQKI